jgi:hypothetical protein
MENYQDASRAYSDFAKSLDAPTKAATMQLLISKDAVGSKSGEVNVAWLSKTICGYPSPEAKTMDQHRNILSQELGFNERQRLFSIGVEARWI